MLVNTVHATIHTGGILDICIHFWKYIFLSYKWCLAESKIWPGSTKLQVKYLLHHTIYKVWIPDKKERHTQQLKDLYNLPIPISAKSSITQPDHK